MNPNIEIMKDKIHSKIEQYLFEPTNEIVYHLTNMFASKEFGMWFITALDQTTGIDDFSIIDSSRPDRMQIDVMVKFSGDLSFYYIPVVINHANV